MTDEAIATLGRKFDGEKPRWDLVPWEAFEPVVDVLTFGARKYTPNNWRHVPEGRRRYFAAALRHLVAWQRGESVDPETGRSHLAHAMCCLLFLAGLEAQDESPLQRVEPEPPETIFTLADAFMVQGYGEHYSAEETRDALRKALAHVRQHDGSGTIIAREVRKLCGDDVRFASLHRRLEDWLARPASQNESPRVDSAHR